MVNIKT